MKTTVEVPDELCRRAKAEAAFAVAAQRVIEEARLALEEPRKTSMRTSLAELMKNACGVIDSEIPDLATNPEYLADFGRDVGDR